MSYDDDREDESAFGGLHWLTAGLFVAAGAEAAFGQRRGDYRPDDAVRWAPLIAAVALLAVTGVGDANTDIVAHLAGFAAGAGTGFLQAKLRSPWLERRTVQLTLGAATCVLAGGAWVWAFQAA